ncbi:MAG: hypothetical protein ABIO14_08860 [Aeromicrobium sp.]
MGRLDALLHPSELYIWGPPDSDCDLDERNIERSADRARVSLVDVRSGATSGYVDVDADYYFVRALKASRKQWSISSIEFEVSTRPGFDPTVHTSMKSIRKQLLIVD